MTDYFDALIRASGLAPEPAPATDGSDRTAAKPARTSVTATELDELDVEHVRAPVERIEAPVPAAEPAPMPAVPVSVRHQTWNDPVASTVREVVPRVTDDVVGRQRQTPPSPPAAPTDAAPAPPPSGAALPSDHVAVVSTQERIMRAAVEWVAADPLRGAIPQSPAPHRPGASPPSTPERAPHPAALQSHDDEVQPDPGASPVRPQSHPVQAVKAAPQFTAGEPPSIVVTSLPRTSVPIAPAVAGQRTSPASTADHRALPPDEVVEISIGAIHVRVDAPTAPAAPAAPVHVSANRPVRDGLRRRALRRI
jgi:hypothetical protein